MKNRSNKGLLDTVWQINFLLLLNIPFNSFSQVKKLRIFVNLVGLGFMHQMFFSQSYSQANNLLLQVITTIDFALVFFLCFLSLKNSLTLKNLFISSWLILRPDGKSYNFNTIKNAPTKTSFSKQNKNIQASLEKIFFRVNYFLEHTQDAEVTEDVRKFCIGI